MATESSTPALDGSQRITSTATDLEGIRGVLAGWLSEQTGHTVEISECRTPTASGVSSVSVLFDASWADVAGQQERSLVARLSPRQEEHPLFPTYDLQLQADVMSFVAERSTVPVPAMLGVGHHDDLGQFIVMERIEGQIPDDNPSYVFQGWVADASPERRAVLQTSTLDVISRIHAIEGVESLFPDLVGSSPDEVLRAHVAGQRAYYEWTLRDDQRRIPVIERTFQWLEDHWPTEVGPPVLSWGDSRIGNIIYSDFRAVGVLDWEMAALGPREMDLGWLVPLHWLHQEGVEAAGLPGMPDLLRRADVVTEYEALSGQTLRNLDFYCVYGELRLAIITTSLRHRMVALGDNVAPEENDEYVMNYQKLSALLAGEYDWDAR